MQARLAAQCGTDAHGLVRALAGDLDWITLKALEKERDRRYQTATELATDIERHLSNRPVSASPPSRVYLARKFMRRHRLGVIFAATTAVLIVGGAAAIAVQARRVSLARAVAVQRQTQAEELINFMLGDLHTRLSAIGGLDVLEKVGKEAQDYFEAVPGGRPERPGAVPSLAGASPDRRGARGARRLRRCDAALPAVALARQRARGTRLSNSEWQLGLGASHFWVGFIHWRRNDLDSALAQFTPYLAITKRARRPRARTACASATSSGRRTATSGR